MKDYTYKGYTFRQTSATTTVYVKNPMGYHYYIERIVYLYEIDGLKERGKRPFLTTIEQCKEYIRNHSGEYKTE